MLFYVLLPISVVALSTGQLLWFLVFMGKRVPTMFIWLAPSIAVVGAIILWATGPGHIVGASLTLGAEVAMIVVVWAYESYLRGMFCKRPKRYCLAYYLGRATVVFVTVPIGIVTIIGAAGGFDNVFAVGEWLLIICIWLFWIIAFRIPLVTNQEKDALPLVTAPDPAV